MDDFVECVNDVTERGVHKEFGALRGAATIDAEFATGVRRGGESEQYKEAQSLGESHWGR